MNKLLAGVAALPFLATTAFAAQPLSDHQMDAVTAGFAAFATAGAEAEGAQIFGKTTTVAEVAQLTTVVVPNSEGGPSETTLNIIKSVSAATSLSSAQSLPSNLAIP